MKTVDVFARRWVENLERSGTRIPHSFALGFLALGVALCAFGFLDKVWGYYLEGVLAMAAGVVLFIVESCRRRIVELKRYLAEYVNAEQENSRRTGSIESLPLHDELDFSEEEAEARI